MVGESQPEVVEVEIQTYQNDTDGGVESFSGRDSVVVVRRNGAIESRVGATNVPDRFGIEFLLDAGLAEDKDGTAVIWEREDS